MPSDLAQPVFRLGVLLPLWLVAGACARSAQGQSPSATQPSAGTSIARSSVDQGSTSQPAANPHWSENGCRYCHAMTGDRVTPIPSAQIDPLCLKCHDGKRAKRELHPIGRTFAATQVKLPEGWPAPGERLVCGTCHVIRRACDHDRRRPADNPGFVREYKTGDLLGFCSHCHVPTPEHERYNPHIMLTKNNEPIHQVCRFCHQEHFEGRERFSRKGDPELRTDEISLCLGCHPTHVDYFEPGHIGIRVPADMKAYMVAFEKKHWAQLSPASQPAHARPPGDEPMCLPLSGGTRVVCSTCHDPHQADLFPPDSLLSFGATVPSQEKQGLRLRLQRLGKGVCRACHNM